MKAPDINALKDYLFSREDVVLAYVFGSYVSQKTGFASDLDIALLLDSRVSRDEYGFIRLQIVTDLVRLLSMNAIDLVILNVATPLLSHEIIKKGKMLFSKDEQKRVEYTVKATRRYLDTIHLRNIQDKILHDKLRRGDFGYFKGSHKYSIEKARKGSRDPSTV